MLSSLKSVIWMFVAASLSLGALVYTTDYYRRFDVTLHHFVPLVQNQKRSVAESTDSIREHPVIYSGAQIIYGLQGWDLEGVEVRIRGVPLPKLNADDPALSFNNLRLSFALSQVELDDHYRAECVFDPAREGQLSEIDFIKL